MPVIRNPLQSVLETEAPSGIRKINKKMDLLDQKLNGLYKDIYVTRPDNRQNMDSIMDKLDKAIDRLQDTDLSVSGMSELLRRIDKDNMPIGMQLIGKHFDEETLLKAAYTYEQNTPWHTMKPSI